jgi:nucleoside-diphosphate-sugar epimerase
MIVAEWSKLSKGVRTHHVVALFGLGVIGTEIFQALSRDHSLRYTSLPLTWSGSEDLVRQEMKAVTDTIHEYAHGDATTYIDVVWAAGRAGFGSSAEVLAGEDMPFREALALARHLDLTETNAHLRFHLLSSAGGLFEGRRHVGAHSEPVPTRPYSDAKLAQERAIATQLPPSVTHNIYRLSSVYGYRTQTGRVGVVVALLKAGLQNKTATIYGLHETMRDYVLADDIGDFIARRIGDETRESRQFILASGRPTSLGEIIFLIEKVLGRRLLLYFQAGNDNVQHNTFLPSALPADWRPTSLEVGISRVLMRLGAD